MDWHACAEEGCIGISAAHVGRCLGHLDSRELEAQLQVLAEAERLDLRGVHLTNELLNKIEGMLPRVIGRVEVKAGLFDAATFAGVGFDGFGSSAHAVHERGRLLEWRTPQGWPPCLSVG